MKGLCGALNGVLLLVAGGAIVGVGMGVDLFKGNMVAGLLLAIVGLSQIVHSLDVCPMCKGSCYPTEKKKK